MKKLDDAFLEKVYKHGRGVITNLSILIKVVGIYSSANEAVLSSANKLVADLGPIIGKDGEVSLSMAENSFFVEDVRIKASLADFESFDALIKELTEKEIGQITFTAPVGQNDIVQLGLALAGRGKAPQIQSELERKLIKSVAVGGVVTSEKETTLDMTDSRLVARRAYMKALASFAEIRTSFEQQRTPSMKKAKRALQSLVDAILKDESYVLGFTVIDRVGRYDEFHLHSINVAILAIVLGKRIGLTKSSMSLLGMAALLHDIGKIELPPELFGKSMDLTEKETALNEKHPADGVRILLRFKGLTETTIISMLAAFEHHINMDGSGYPHMPHKRELNPLSQIIAVADSYELLVNAKVFGERLFSAHEAPRESLNIIYSRSGKKFNETLVKTLAAAIL